MQVIGVGFGRTGTTSLKYALEALGLGPCYHMMDVMADARRIRQWLAIGRGTPPDWGQIFAGYHSTVDWPAATYWRELADAYPDAKLVLTVRDPQAWYDSVRRTIFQSVIDPPGGLRPVAFRILAALSPNLRAFLAMTDACVQQPVFEGRVADRQYAISVFERHVDEVRAAFPPDRLLVYEVREGWAPLCAFLGRTVPDRPFPHENTTEAFGRTVGPLIGRLALGPLVRPSPR
jgi:sulfotransferase family protein